MAQDTEARPCALHGPRVPGKRASAFLQLCFRHYRLACGIEDPQGSWAGGRALGKAKMNKGSGSGGGGIAVGAEVADTESLS